MISNKFLDELRDKLKEANIRAHDAEYELEEIQDELLRARTRAEVDQAQLDKLQAEVERLRRKIREDHPGIGLRALVESLAEPLPCGHHVDNANDKTGECERCTSDARAEALQAQLEVVRAEMEMWRDKVKNPRRTVRPVFPVEEELGAATEGGGDDS